MFLSYVCLRLPLSEEKDTARKTKANTHTRVVQVVRKLLLSVSSRVVE